MKRKALTFEQAEEIRALYKTGQYLQKEIADRYDVLSKTISQVCNNEVLTGAPRKKREKTAEAAVTYRGMACDTKILTDSGWKLAEDVVLTDKLVAIDGTYTNIVSIHRDEPSPLFKVSFLDNVSIVTAADHRWMTLDQKVGYREGWMLRATERLGKLSNGFHIPTCQAVPGKKWEGKDPYVIGLLLGDGSTVPGISNATIYNKDQYILDYMKNNFGWSQYNYVYNGKEICPRVQSTKTEETRAWKDAAGRSKAHFKFVPPDLLQADPETRLAVIQGLMDTDGCADKEGRMTFASVSDKLSSDLRYLVRSLGGKSNSAYSDRGPTGLGGGPYYRTTITPCNKFIPFRLPRKIERCHEMKGEHRNMNSIEQVETAHSISFVVTHSSHQFVVQDFIVVHDATGIPSCRKLPTKKTISSG